MEIPEHRVGVLLEEVYAEFSSRHQRIQHTFMERFGQVRKFLPDCVSQISVQRQLLIGSYFVNEYSIESAALFNPSIVPDPNQSGMPAGALRFIMSLRSTGEGHISSITFRSGILYPDHRIEVLPSSGFVTEGKQIFVESYEKPLFERKLQEMGLVDAFSHRVMDQLGDPFIWEDFSAVIDAELKRARTQENRMVAQEMRMLARLNFEICFHEGQELSERVIFPATPQQRNGIEDARFTCFRDDNGDISYYATFTAYDGRVILPELVETTDFLRFQFISLNGKEAENKGMSMFPRKIKGRYAMISRQDDENIFLMYSENVHFWNEKTFLLGPANPWEITKIGNCGSPIETEAGWLVLSHGVGPVRKYCLGAFLLDREDPSKVIGRLREPLLQPDREEREGYVPNVVYTCGALLHKDMLIIPYGASDYTTRFATVPVGDVLAAMT